MNKLPKLPRSALKPLETTLNSSTRSSKGTVGLNLNDLNRRVRYKSAALIGDTAFNRAAINPSAS
jgi:hypothetical protein